VTRHVALLRRAPPSDHLLRGAYCLSINVVATTGIGVIFWITAARLYDPASVGRDAALIAAMVELSTICQLNLVNALTRFLPALERRTARALSAAYVVSGTVALVIGVVFVVVAPMASDQFRFLRDDSAMAVLYVIAQILWTWFMLEDAVLAALRRAQWVPVENATFGVLKLLALPLLVALGATHGVFLASILPVVFLLVPVNLFLFLRAIPDHQRLGRPAASLLHRFSRRRMIGFMAQDYGATVLSQASTTVLPVLVVSLLGARANAYFYIPYTMVVSFAMLFYGACTALVVEGARAEAGLHTLAQRLVRRFAVILIPGVVTMVAAAPLILVPFGADYVHGGTPVLRILACGCLFRAVSILYEAIARVQGRGSRILAIEATQASLLLVGVAALAAPMGLEGVALAWLGATALPALAALPWLVRFLHSGPVESAVTHCVTDPSRHEVVVE
jgi:O-antigen/teichoic acid export membrane protein